MIQTSSWEAARLTPPRTEREADCPNSPALWKGNCGPAPLWLRCPPCGVRKPGGPSAFRQGPPLRALVHQTFPSMRGAHEAGWVLASTASQLKVGACQETKISISNLFIDGSSLKGRISFTAALQIRSILPSESHLQQNNMKTDVAGPRCGIAGYHCLAVTSELGKA